MNPKTKKRTPRTPAFKKTNGECVIPGAMPAEALAGYVLKTGDDEADRIRSYLEWQAHGETVKHLEKVASESLFGRQMDAWDVRTNKNRWWVITEPTNLYSQKLFPSLDYTLSFHVGVTTRAIQYHMTEEQHKAEERFNRPWNKLAGAYATLFAAKKAEDFQSAGMKCRECLLSLAQSLGQADMLPEGQEAPQGGNFIDWSELIAEHLAGGGSSERLRSYLKAIAKSTWQLVNWLTHAQNAGRFDGAIATQATENVLESFMGAWAKNEALKQEANKKRRTKKRG